MTSIEIERRIIQLAHEVEELRAALGADHLSVMSTSHDNELGTWSSQNTMLSFDETYPKRIERFSVAFPPSNTPERTNEGKVFYNASAGQGSHIDYWTFDPSRV